MGVEELVAFVHKTTTWSGLENDLKTKVLPFAKQNGAEVFGAVGTCWGSCPTVKMCAWDEFKAGVSMHPSHTPLFQMLGEDEKAALEAIKCPQYFMPAGNDGPECKPGGIAEQILKDQLTNCEFSLRCAARPSTRRPESSETSGTYMPNRDPIWHGCAHGRTADRQEARAMEKRLAQ